MTILVFSDSHGNIYNMCKLIDEFVPDIVIHLGDYARDAELLKHKHVISVYGNCDYNRETPKCILLEIEGKRCMLTHGHKYGVKSGLKDLIREATLNGADIVLYGHTHKQYYAMHGDMVILNPGAADAQAAYLVIKDDKIEVKLL